MTDEFSKKSRIYIVGDNVSILFNLSDRIPLCKVFNINDVEYSLSVERGRNHLGKLCAKVVLSHKDTEPEDEFDKDVYESTDVIPRDGMIRYKFDISNITSDGNIEYSFDIYSLFV